MFETTTYSLGTKEGSHGWEGVLFTSTAILP